ncbi:MAG: hypothetical protein HY746_03335 [Elusimicrobia bacterium]|nr:hypothetical protein [Elusimicrobiota bacterium]
MRYMQLSLLGLVLLVVGFRLTNAQEEFKPTMDFKGSRVAIGYIDSKYDGSFPVGSFQMPDGKLRFNWNTTPDITFVTRISFSNTTVAGFDYFYMDYKNFLTEISPAFKDGLFNPTLRLGRIKLDIGEETWSDNSVESIVVSNSAGLVNGYDEGAQLHQSLKKDQLGIPVKWSLSLTNGNKDTGADNQSAKAICFKAGINPINELYISGSYYNSGELLTADADVAYAGLKSRPVNATEWTRNIIEVDMRYDFKPVKEDRLNPGAPAWSDSKAYIRTAYGQFKDDGEDTAAPITEVADRKGIYYFAEGGYNLTEKIYLGGRHSKIEFDKNDVFAILNSVANANAYTRTSFGAGYRLSGNAHAKFEYVKNSEKMQTGSTEPKNDQIVFLITAKF